MKALVLAAGYATRLYPLTKKFPKPLLMVGKRPIIDYIIDKLERVEAIDEIIVVTNSKFVSRFRRWAASCTTSKRLSVLDDLTRDEATKRGAIGDMHFAVARKHIKDDLLVIGGDNLFDSSLDEFLRFAGTCGRQPVIGAYDIQRKAEARRYGVLRLDRRKRVIDFQEKPLHPATALVAMCLYYFPRQRLELIKKYLEAKTGKKDATGFYIDWLRTRVPVYGFVFCGTWFDIGHPEFYRQAQKVFR